MNEQGAIPDLALEDVLEGLGLQDAILESAETRATDTRVWRVRRREKTLAIRVFRESQQRVLRIESEAMDLARANGVPAPGVVAAGLIEQRYPAMAIDWLPGELIGEAVLRNPALARRLGHSAGQLMVRMHLIQTPLESSGSSLGDDWIARSERDDPELRARLEAVAESHLSLLHLDYHPFNLLASGGRITGVLDWTNAVFGDRRADIARTVSLLSVVAPAMIAPRGAARMSIGLLTRAFLRGYVSSAGALTDMAPFYAWAGGMILADLAPKLHTFPIANPAVFTRKIENWTISWRSKALGD